MRLIKLIGAILLLVLLAGCIQNNNVVSNNNNPDANPSTIEQNEYSPNQEPSQPAPPELPPEQQASSVAAGTKEFDMIAKNWEFVPSQIVVSQGDTVTLHITSEDVTHGISIPGFGINENLVPGQTVTVTFTADKKGIFPFTCSVYCGAGHGSMTGEIIVE